MTFPAPLVHFQSTYKGLGWLAFIAMALALSGSASGQISPGPLSAAHQQLESVTKCASCHDFGAGSRSFKCMECHTEIRSRLNAKAGFHARSVKASAGETDCARCHMEHNGRTFALVRLTRNPFNHKTQTGFRLEGKHSQQKCESCHNAKNAGSARAAIKVRDLNRTFLGLRRECTSCHADQHNGRFGSDCTQCHTQSAWKPAPGFNHSKTSFPLTGLHEKVACQQCHGPKPGETAAKFKGIGGGGCVSCHADPHRGAFREASFRGSCDSCHNTGGWKNSHLSEGFNHMLTKFPLTGKHQGVSCESCHKTADFHRPVAHNRCQDCHADPHNKQFAARAAGSDCSSCHRDTGFQPATFDVAMHRTSAFPLDGKHADVSCAKCHTPAGRATVYHTGKLTCSACHADQHAGEFAASPYGNQCQFCHSASGFEPTSFSLLRHAKTSFPLTGGHASVECRNCHQPPAGRAVITQTAKFLPPRQFHFPSQACNTCHSDPHSTSRECEQCHVQDAWRAVRPFNHDSTRYPLRATHKEVACTLCHNPPGTPRTLAARVVPVFSNTPTKCSECHAAQDPHGGQFAKGARVEDCSACHVESSWKKTTFDHDRARFALDIAHRNVTCVKCHKDRPGPDAKLVRSYRDTPRECVKCH